MKAQNLFFAFVAIVFMRHAHADDCGPGYYYNDNNECVACQHNHYCTGDGTMQPCPEVTYDNIEELYPMVIGYNVHSIDSAYLRSQYVYTGNAMTNIERCCFLLRHIQVDEGMIYTYPLQYSVQTGGYTNFRSRSMTWGSANAGYYLSTPYSNTNNRWKVLKPCTNTHPANSHYSGPGTPDSQDGTIVDANDCPWECDSGYGQTDSGECLQLCAAGVTEFHAGDLMFNIYANKQTTPSINIKYNDTICYVSLATGSTTNALHVKYQDMTYHTIN